MTSRDRVLNALNFQKTDTIPIYDIINNKKVYELYGGIEDIDKCSDIKKTSAVLADMDIVDIRKKYPKLALVGGIDCSELLSFGSLDDIRKEVERIIRSIGEYGGILLGSTSEIHNGIPPENCRYLYETIKELGAGL